MTGKLLFSALAVLLSVATGASAATLSGHGSLFVAFNAGQAQNVDYTTGGARSNVVGTQQLIAPVIRNEISSGSQLFSLHGSHSGFQTSFCTLHSAQADGGFIASKNMDVLNTAGIWGRTASMSLAELPPQGKVSVICTIPGGFSATLAGVTSTP